MLTLSSATSLLVLPSPYWSGVIEELRKTAHPADFWAPEDLAKGISIGQARELISFAQQTALGTQKIICIAQADRLSREVANALLKLLEEPPSAVKVLLLAESSHLLPTLRSRARQLALPSDFATILREQTSSLSRRARWDQLLTDYNPQLPKDRQLVQSILYAYPLIHPGIKDEPFLEAYRKLSS